MGHSREDKAASHERILEAASTTVRERGLEAPTVGELMRAAGLTHGGFYKHFADRDDLVAQAVEHAGRRSADALTEVLAGDHDEPLQTFLDWYVSEAHCADPANGCSVAALAGDAGRAGPRVRAAMTEQVARYLDALGTLVGDDRDRAIETLTRVVGAIVLARAVDDPDLGAEILEATRRFTW